MTYNFEDNIHCRGSASVIILYQKHPDIYFDILDREMLIKAQLYKNGEMIEEIPNISSDCIRRWNGSPDDNVVQFVFLVSRLSWQIHYKNRPCNTEGNQ